MEPDNHNRIYLDFMASTPVDDRVVEAMRPLWEGVFAHPYSLHKEGREAQEHILKTKKEIASHLEVKESELIFTSGGTESNSLGTQGVLEALKNTEKGLAGKRILMSSIEHPSVAGIVSFAESEGMVVDRCPITEEGCVDMEAFQELLSPDTVLVSIMYVNSEIGTIQPLRDITRSVREYEKQESIRIYVHTDASQAALYLDCRPHVLGVDLMTLDGHKMYGPKGVGMLYRGEGVPLAPLFISEKSTHVRPGTPATPLIVGFGKAFHVAHEERKELGEKVSQLRDWFIQEVETRIPHARLNGGRDKRAPHNISFSFDGVNHEFLLVTLDTKGVAAATRSACLSRGKEGSHVLEALHNHWAPEAIRFSLGKETTQEELEKVISILEENV